MLILIAVSTAAGATVWLAWAVLISLGTLGGIGFGFALPAPMVLCIARKVIADRGHLPKMTDMTLSKTEA